MAKVQATEASRKQLGAPESKTRSALIEAAKDLMRNEGYAAVTSRRIAQKAGQKHQVIFYYFATLDDLLLEVLRQGAEEGLGQIKRALHSKSPLNAIWTTMLDARGGKFIQEFMALANRNEAIRDELARYGAETRRLQTAALADYLKARGIEPAISPMLVTILMTALARLLANEARLGLNLGHDQAEALVRACMEQFERTGDSAAVASLFSPAPEKSEKPAARRSRRTLTTRSENS